MDFWSNIVLLTPVFKVNNEHVWENWGICSLNDVATAGGISIWILYLSKSTKTIPLLKILHYNKASIQNLT